MFISKIIVREILLYFKRENKCVCDNKILNEKIKEKNINKKVKYVTAKFISKVDVREICDLKRNEFVLSQREEELFVQK